MNGLDIFKGIEDVIREKKKENEYNSSFDFEKFGVDERNKKYIVEREQIIFDNAKTYSSSLYQICKALGEIKSIFMNKGIEDEETFAEWYRSAGLHKDKVSELLKRNELYMLAPDKIDYISSLSIPAVKFLTRKQLDDELKEKVLELELKKIEDMEEIVMSENKDESQLPKKTSFETKTFKFYQKRISKATSLKELVKEKNNIIDLIKSLNQLKKEIEDKEKEQENENNLNLFEKEYVFKDELNRIFVLEFNDEIKMYETVRYLTVEDYKERSFREVLSIIAPEKSLKIAKEKFLAYAIMQPWREYKEEN
jgi:hypothetical protein